MQSDKNYYPASFKAAVALAALRNEQPAEELAARFGVPADQVREWAGILEQQAGAAFAQPAPQQGEGDELLDSSEMAKAIAENSTQGFAMMDRRGYCVYANRAWLDMTGYSAEEIGAQPLHYLVHHHHPDGRPYPMEECPIDRALPENFDVRAHEDLFFRKDGSSFEVACAASPIFRNGEPAFTIIEIRDVTEQKRQARELLSNERHAVQLAQAAEERQRQLDAVLDATPVGIGVVDTNGKLILVNRANRELWGESMTMAEAVDQYADYQGWWADGGTRDGQPLRPRDWALARVLAGESVDNDIVEIAPFYQHAARKTIALSARPIHDEHGAIRGAVVAQVDITLQKQAELALRQADRNKDDFIAILAHELRNPLAPIRTAVDLFRMFDAGNPVLKRATEAMARQVAHITRLVDDLLDVARISRGRIELRREPCDIVRVVTQTAGDYRESVQANGVELRIEVGAAPLWVDGDGARLVQIVGNLLHNAAKFTHEGNRITVRAGEHEGPGGPEAVIEVEDDGAGMAPELMATLFQPFIQAAQGLDRSGGGLGLGLALVKGLAELHGGSVSASSRGPGLGACFTVRLPLRAAAARPVVEGGGPGLAESLRIVAIDDNQDALEMLGLLFSASGHAVSTAFDGPAGMESIRQVRPHVVVCDIGLPGKMNGYDVARAVRAEPGLAHTVLIALSGYGQESDKRQSAAAGFDVHLVKPMSYPDLEEAIRKALPGRGAMPVNQQAP